METACTSITELPEIFISIKSCSDVNCSNHIQINVTVQFRAI